MIDQKFDLRTVASEIVLRFYLTLGFVGLISLIALGITSTDGMIRRLGNNWGKLHRLAYVIGVIAVVHFALQKKLDIYEPLLMTGFLFWLLAFRARAALCARGDVPLAARACRLSPHCSPRSMKRSGTAFLPAWMRFEFSAPI